MVCVLVLACGRDRTRTVADELCGSAGGDAGGGERGRCPAPAPVLPLGAGVPGCIREGGGGVDAVVGNPPWDIAKPVSMEFFSNIDPLYRSYGKQEALSKQTEYFGRRGGGARLARLLR